MKRLDPKTFGYHCYTTGLTDLRGSVATLCDYFITHVVPVLKIEVENLPPEEICGRVEFNHGALNRTDAVDALSLNTSHLMSSTKAKALIIAIAGEDHTELQDKKRAEDLIRNFMALKFTDHALLYLERGLEITHNRLLINSEIIACEKDIVAGYGSECTRSVIAAAYCVACLAGGNQSKKAKVLMLFGNNHVADIQEAFTYLIEVNPPYPWLRNRPRGIHILTTQSTF